MKLKYALWGIVVLMVVGLAAGLAFAHGGGLNSEGCHNNRKTGDYHCHRGSSSSSSSSRSRYRPPPPPKPGKLKITTVPKARIYVDGTYLGVSPVKANKVEPGTYTIRVEHRLLGTSSRTVGVQSRETTDVEMRW